MEDFAVYFDLGLNHILDLNGSDHILFVIVMIIIYKYNDWKNILLIITSFTIAHSITLILASIDLITLNRYLVELLIGLTILFTAIENIFIKKLHKHRVFISGVFGLIHGLGFSSYFKSLMPDDFSIVDILFPFNLGIEVGQIVIVLGLIIVLIGFDQFKKIKKEQITLFASSLIAIQSIIWIVERVGNL